MALTLTFTETVTLKLTKVRLRDAQGKDWEIGDASLSAYGLTLTIPIVATLAAGTYAVDWDALAEDSHNSHGSFTFTVK